MSKKALGPGRLYSYQRLPEDGTSSIFTLGIRQPFLSYCGLSLSKRINSKSNGWNTYHVKDKHLSNIALPQSASWMLKKVIQCQDQVA